MKLRFLLLIVVLVVCGYFTTALILPNKSYDVQSNLNKNGNSIAERYLVDNDFERLKTKDNSFAFYLQNLPLHEFDHKVHYYNGQIKEKGSVYESVVKMDIGKKNLLQCADAVMRLRAEYLFKQKKYSEIHFNFTNGFKASYDKWMKGYRIKVNGNSVSWILKASPSNTYSNFIAFMEMVFTYAGTMSLSKELFQKDFSKLNIGDVFIRGGSPGHAVIVVDMIENKKSKKKYFMLAQSYMPAQEIQILFNPKVSYSVWYELDSQVSKIITPEWIFEKAELKSFEKSE